MNTVIIGRGNLSWHLAPNLERAGHRVELWPGGGQEAWPRGEAPDLVVLAVPDDAISSVSRRLTAYLPPGTPIVHTSGATPVERIDAAFTHRGALWPIRSLRRGEAVADWRDLPLVYYSPSPTLEALLAELAEQLSDLTYRLDDEQRAQLHLAAVFSNNFVTYLYQLSYELCTARGIPFEVLLPIIRNTALSQDGGEPALRQTGAAARGDEATMQRHLSLLTEAEKQVVYRLMSEGIGKRVDNRNIYSPGARRPR